MTDALKMQVDQDTDQLALFSVDETQVIDPGIKKTRITRRNPSKYVHQLVLSIFDDQESDESVLWSLSEDELYEFHEKLLTRSLRVLAHSCSQEESILDVLNWALLEPDMEELFSFYMCCLTSGLNPDQMRGHIRRIVKKMPIAEKLGDEYFNDDIH